jgi:undecaprenyl-diphosphatase
MNLIQSLFLGVVQGLTEFLPISSSGHLVIVQSLIPNFSQPGIVLDVVLHAGTIFSILIYFWKNLYILVKKYWIQIIVGSIPAGILGVLIESRIETVFESTMVVGFALIITAFLNFLTDKTKSTKSKVGFKSALFIGIAQAIAIVPGISRSGSTIFAGTKMGIEKKDAAEFSFLLSIPAVLGANLLQISKFKLIDNDSLFIYLVGFVSAFISGYFAIKIVYKALKRNGFKYFSYYLIAVGVLVLVFL